MNPLGIIWSLLTSKAAGPIAAILAAVLLAWGVTERVQLAGARLHAKQLTAEAAGAKADLTTCKANERSLNASLSAQNAAVAALAVKSSQTADALDKAASDARSARAVAEGRAAAIMALKPVGDRCKAAEALLRAQ